MNQGPAQFIFCVAGDWHSIIRSDERYRDALLNQKPYDEDDATFNEYRIPCGSSRELLEAIAHFHVTLGFDCHVAVHIRDESCEAFACSGNPWDEKAGAYYELELKGAGLSGDGKAKVRAAHRLLGEALS